MSFEGADSDGTDPWPQQLAGGLELGVHRCYWLNNKLEVSLSYMGS